MRIKNKLLKPNEIIEREPQKTLVYQQSQGNVSKITVKRQPYRIICLFVRPENISILDKG